MTPRCPHDPVPFLLTGPAVYPTDGTDTRHGEANMHTPAMRVTGDGTP